MESATLTQLVYVSCSRVPANGVDAILESAQRRNPTLGLTGALLYTGQYFFQILEGPAESVDSMYKEILRDARHHSIKVLEQQPVKAREFPQWSMGSVSLSAVDQLISPLFSVADEERTNIIAKLALQALRRAAEAAT